MTAILFTLENSENIDSVSSKISDLDNIKNVEYHKDVVDNFIKISDSIRNFGSILIVFLILILLSYNIKYNKN